MIQLFTKGRYGSCSTNRTDPAEIDKLIEQTLASVRLLAPDPCRMLVPASLRYNGPPLHGWPHDQEIDTNTKNLCFLTALPPYTEKSLL